MGCILYLSKEYTEHDWRFLTKLVEEHQVWFLRTGPLGYSRENRPLPQGVTLIDWVLLKNEIKPMQQLKKQKIRFENLVNEIQPDLIQAGPVQLGGFLPALIQFKPLILVSWASDLLCQAEQDTDWLEVTRKVLLNSQGLICDSETVRQKTQSFISYPDEKIIQFPWGVEMDLFQTDCLSDIRSRLGWEEGFVLIATRPYNFEIILEAFRKTHSVEKRLKLLFLGASIKDRVRDWARSYHLENHVHAAGQVSHKGISHYFQNSDLYLSASPSDGTSISLLEAYACGLPVLVSDNSSNREWVEESNNGWLANAYSVDEFAQKIDLALRTNNNMLRLIGKNNRNIVELRADWNKNSQKFLVFLRQFMAEKDNSANKEL